jgi:UDP:flavonoid glycosyltransferase YjiC (YdhE family)
MMSRKGKALLVTWDGAGNLAPERALVRALIARGHGVRALAHDSVREQLERDGAECLDLRGVRPYDSRQPKPTKEEMSFVVEHIWYARAFGSELLAAVERERPDLLLVDISLTHALVAARRTGLPTAVLCHFPYYLSFGPFAPLFASLLNETNGYASELGLPPFPSHQALIEAASLVLVASYLPFDRLEAMAPHVMHVGPCRSGDDGGDSWRRRTPGRPLVLVALSTSHQHQAPLLQRLCDALGALEVEALVTTGAAVDPTSLRTADNTTAVSFVPHDVVLPATDLLVTHAGHGTVMAGVTYGVPMLCLPMGRDQPMNAERVVELGLGSLVSAESPVADIRHAIVAMLADADTRTRAAELARSLAGHPGLDDAVASVENLLATHPS